MKASSAIQDIASYAPCPPMLPRLGRRIRILDLAFLELDLGMGILLVPLTRCLDLRFSTGPCASLRLLWPPWSCTVRGRCRLVEATGGAHPRHRLVGEELHPLGTAARSKVSRYVSGQSNRQSDCSRIRIDK